MDRACITVYVCINWESKTLERRPGDQEKITVGIKSGRQKNTLDMKEKKRLGRGRRIY